MHAGFSSGFHSRGDKHIAANFKGERQSPWGRPISKGGGSTPWPLWNNSRVYVISEATRSRLQISKLPDTLLPTTVTVSPLWEKNLALIPEYSTIYKGYKQGLHNFFPLSSCHNQAKLLGCASSGKSSICYCRCWRQTLCSWFIWGCSASEVICTILRTVMYLILRIFSDSNLQERKSGSLGRCCCINKWKSRCIGW